MQCYTRFFIFGGTNDRSFCVVSQEDGHLLHMGPSSPSTSCRCFFNELESDVCVCISSHLSNSQSFATHEAGSMSSHSNSSTMAKETMVSGSVGKVHCRSHKVATETRIVKPIEIHNIPSGFHGLQSECMASFDRQFQTRGFSQIVRVYCQHRGGKTTLVNSSCSVVVVVRNKLIYTQHL